MFQTPSTGKRIFKLIFVTFSYLCFENDREWITSKYEVERDCRDN